MIIFLVVGLLAGGAVTAVSGYLGDWDSDWLESVFANGGVTLFLAVPVAIFLARLSGSIDSVGKRVTSIQTDVDKAKSDIQDLREESSRAAATIASRNERIFSAGSSDISPQRVKELVEAATEQELISESGYRVAVDQSERRFVRFSHTLGFKILSIQVEDHGGSAELVRSTYGTSDIGAILGEIHIYLADNGHRQTEPFGPVQSLISEVDNIRTLRAYDSDLVGHVQESMPGNWYISDSGTFHVRPTYQISMTQLRDEGMGKWISHMREKGWVDYDETLYAIRTAYALLVEKRDPPF